MKSCRSYFLASTFISIGTYLTISMISPIPCIRLLCLTHVFFVLIDYVLFQTFFLSCLVINLKRLGANRHCLSCLQLSKDYYIEIPQQPSRTEVFKKKFNFLSSIDQLFKLILLGFVCLMSLVITVFSIWSIFSIDTRLFDDRFLPRNATSLRSYMRSQTEDYSLGPVIMFTIPRTMKYTDSAVQNRMKNLIQQCINDSNTNDFRLLWLEKENLQTILHGNDPLNMRVSLYSKNDLILKSIKGKIQIRSSRFYCQYKTIQGKYEFSALTDFRDNSM